EPPLGALARERGDRGVQTKRALGQPPCDRLHERAHAARGRGEERIARARSARRAGLARGGAEPEDDAPVPPLELEESRHRRRQRELLRIAAVDAADERLRHALERFLAEAAAHERREALVAVRSAWQDQVER